MATDDEIRLEVYRDQYRGLTTKEHAYGDAAASLNQELEETRMELSRVRGRLQETLRRKDALLSVARSDGFSEEDLAKSSEPDSVGFS